MAFIQSEKLLNGKFAVNQALSLKVIVDLGKRYAIKLSTSGVLNA